MNKRQEQTYLQALSEAYEMMEIGVEPTSALKQAGSDNGISYGKPMGAFVDWARAQMNDIADTFNAVDKAKASATAAYCRAKVSGNAAKEQP